MSFTDLFPALRGSGRRRVADRLAELREENARLHDELAAAEDHIATLTEDAAATRAALAAERERRRLAEQELQRAESVIRLRDQRIADLERRIDVGVKAEHVIARTQELSVEEIRRHCVKPLWESPLANPHRVRAEPDPAA